MFRMEAAQFSTRPITRGELVDAADGAYTKHGRLFLSVESKD